MKKRKLLISSAQSYPHFLAVWTKLETFYFQIFSLKKRGKLSSLFTPPFFSVCLLFVFCFERKLEVFIKWQEVFHKLLEKKQCKKLIVRLKHWDQGLYIPTATITAVSASLTLQIFSTSSVSDDVRRSSSDMMFSFRGVLNTKNQPCSRSNRVELACFLCWYYNEKYKYRHRRTLLQTFQKTISRLACAGKRKRLWPCASYESALSRIFLSMCDVKIFLTFTSPNMVLLWQLFYLFCSCI